MKINKKNLFFLGLIFGIMLFYIGLACNIALGPSNENYQLPRQVSSVFKLSGMGLICISMFVGGFFIDGIDNTSKMFLVLFGLFFLLLSIFVLSVT